VTGFDPDHRAALGRAIAAQDADGSLAALWVAADEPGAGAAPALSARLAAELVTVGDRELSSGRAAEALAALRESIARRPRAAAYVNLGNVWLATGDLDAAREAYEAAVRLDPGRIEPRGNLAAVHHLAAEHDLAADAARRAVEQAGRAAAAGDPAAARMARVLHGNFVYQLHFHPRVTPGHLLEEHREWERRYARPFRTDWPTQPVFPGGGELTVEGEPPSPGRRLRVGYVSPDFRDHVVGRNLVPLLAGHDHDRFEVIAYADLRTPGDALTERLVSACDGWVDVSALDDARLAERVRADRVDVLVDCTLHMSQNRLPALARRPAPVQVTFAGYPSTTGLSAIDFRLSDPYLDPPGAASPAAEACVRLARSFWCYDPLGVDVEVGAPPADANGYVTFGSLGSFAKTNDDVLALWAQVLSAVPGSRLLLLADRGRHRGRTVEVLAARGVRDAAARVEFVAPQPRAGYLATYNRVDIALDTFPYNAHTTALDALWMGVPVVTLCGQMPVSRAGFSHLSNLGLTEWVAHSAADYVRIAAQLAGDAEGRRFFRRTLRGRLMGSALADGRRFAGDVERAYLAMWAARVGA